MKYIITKNLEKVIDFSCRKALHSFITEIKTEYFVFCNNVRISNRIHEHKDSLKLKTHDFKIRKRNRNIGRSGGFEILDHFNMETKHLKKNLFASTTLICKKCKMHISYEGNRDYYLSCEEYQDIIRKGPAHNSHKWNLLNVESDAYKCEVCQLNAYYAPSMTKNLGYQWKYHMSGKNILRWDDDSVPSCEVFKMDEAIG